MFDELDDQPDRPQLFKWILLAVASLFLAIFVFRPQGCTSQNHVSESTNPQTPGTPSEARGGTAGFDTPFNAAPSRPVSLNGGSPASIDQLPLPSGYQRIAKAGEMAAYCRNLALKPSGTKVRLFDGKEKPNQSAHVAVLAMDVGKRDLQQCADAMMRIRGEYLFKEGRFDDISFNFTSGDACAWSRWKEGWRPVVKGNNVSWDQSRPPADDYESFRHYLDRVFIYAGSASLSQEMEKIAFKDMQIGDVMIKGGFPGHAVMVLDMARNARGKTLYLLAQSYTPAQEIHVLKNPNDRNLSPWYDLAAEGEIVTPEWTFKQSDLKRFR